MNVRPLLLALALGGVFVAPQRPARADDKKEKVDPKVAAKEKAVKKAKEDLEKECKGKKLDPQPAISFFEKCVDQAGLEVPAAKDMVHKVMAKKIPWEQAATGLDEKMRGAVDEKTNKIDAKKVEKDFAKWVSEWKPEKKEDPKK